MDAIELKIIADENGKLSWSELAANFEQGQEYKLTIEAVQLRNNGHNGNGTQEEKLSQEEIDELMEIVAEIKARPPGQLPTQAELDESKLPHVVDPQELA